MAQPGPSPGGNRFRSHPSCPWPLLCKDALENDTPSRRQGMPAKKERAMCGSLAKMIRETGEGTVALRCAHV